MNPHHTFLHHTFPHHTFPHHDRLDHTPDVPAVAPAVVRTAVVPAVVRDVAGADLARAIWTAPDETSDRAALRLCGGVDG